MSIQEKPGCQKGFTLVELMVALVIGLLIIFGATQLFVTTKVSFNRMGEVASRQESLRFLVDTLSLDIRSSSVVGVEVVDGDDTLMLEYDSRTNDPYCGGSSDLVSVRYSYSSNELSFSYDCGSGLSAAEPLIKGLEDVDFYDFVSDPDADGKKGYVEVFVFFFSLPGESASDSEFGFRVANREAVAR